MPEKDSKTIYGENHRIGDAASPYPVSRLAPGYDLVDIAKEISQADAMINTRVNAKLKVIADQIRALQAEARKVLQETQRDQDLHQIPCSFHRRPGSLYHLYQRDNGSRYFAMLSPQEWGGNPPHAFLGSYRLELDMSWTPADRLDEQDDSRELVSRLLEEKRQR